LQACHATQLKSLTWLHSFLPHTRLDSGNPQSAALACSLVCMMYKTL
jgi:hypothetical protein